MTSANQPKNKKTWAHKNGQKVIFVDRPKNGFVHRGQIGDFYRPVKEGTKLCAEGLVVRKIDRKVKNSKLYMARKTVKFWLVTKLSLINSSTTLFSFEMLLVL